MITIGYSKTTKNYYLVSYDLEILKCIKCLRLIELEKTFVLHTLNDNRILEQFCYCNNCFEKHKKNILKGYLTLICIKDIVPKDIIPVLSDTSQRNITTSSNRLFQGSTILSDDDIKQDQKNKVAYVTKGKLISMDENRNIMPEYEQAQIQLKLRAEAEKVIPKTSEDVDNFFDNLLTNIPTIENKRKETQRIT